MITQNGTIFHIDFGYILGFEPKNFHSLGMRITQDMVDALGGVQSKDYARFLKYCDSIYNNLRRYTNFILNLMLTLVDREPTIENGIQFTKNLIYKELTDRFIPGETYLHAKVSLYNQIENSSKSLSYKFRDWLHYHNQENSIGSVFSSTAKMAGSFFDNLAGGFD
jgi:phosphatidylinositol kinase/protein kinase (PI-3  family)